MAELWSEGICRTTRLQVDLCDLGQPEENELAAAADGLLAELTMPVSWRARAGLGSALPTSICERSGTAM